MKLTVFSNFMGRNKALTLGLVALVAAILHGLALFHTPAPERKIANKGVQTFVQHALESAHMTDAIKISQVKKVAEGRFEVLLDLKKNVDAAYRDELSNYVRAYAMPPVEGFAWVKFQKADFFSLQKAGSIAAGMTRIVDILALLVAFFMTVGLAREVFRKHKEKLNSHEAREEEYEIRIGELKTRVNAMSVSTPKIEALKHEIAQLEHEIKGINYLWNSSVGETHELKRQLESLRRENQALRSKMSESQRQRDALEKEFSASIRTKFREETAHSLDLL